MKKTLRAGSAGRHHRSMRIRRAVPVLLLAVALSGCGYVFETAVTLAFDGAADGVGVPAPAMVVADKYPPTTLVARDGSQCEVPAARFDHIRVGQKIVCVWANRAFRAGPIGPHY